MVAVRRGSLKPARHIQPAERSEKNTRTEIIISAKSTSTKQGMACWRGIIEAFVVALDFFLILDEAIYASGHTHTPRYTQPHQCKDSRVLLFEQTIECGAGICSVARRRSIARFEHLRILAVGLGITSYRDAS